MAVAWKMSAWLLAGALLVGCERGDEAVEGTLVEQDGSAGQPGDSGQAEPAASLDWERAEREIRRLSPDMFADLPDAIQTQLEEMDCLVPQAWSDPEAHNVVRGTFAVPGQIDWAALCSAEGANRIVVIWGGPVECPQILGEARDRDLLQGVGGTEVGFSRAIHPADPEQILRYHDEFGGPNPPSPLTHQGINDAFLGKASVVWYCEGGDWLKLTGMD